MNPYAENKQESECEEEFTAVERVRRVLRSGERIVWVGAPAIRHFIVLFVFEVLSGAVLCSLSPLIIRLVTAPTMRDPKSGPVLIGGLVALAFLALGLKLVTAPWTSAVRLRKVVYAVTNQRGLVLTDGDSLLFSNPVEMAVEGTKQTDFEPDQLMQWNRMRVIGFNRVDLIFATAFRGGSKGRKYKVYLGFFGLDDPQAVEELIERTFGQSFAERQIDHGLH